MLFTHINCPFLPGSFDGHLSNATHQDPIAITRKTIDDQCESIERLPEIVAWIKSIYAIKHLQVAWYMRFHQVWPCLLRYWTQWHTSYYWQVTLFSGVFIIFFFIYGLDNHTKHKQ